MHSTPDRPRSVSSVVDAGRHGTPAVGIVFVSNGTGSPMISLVARSIPSCVPVLSVDCAIRNIGLPAFPALFTCSVVDITTVFIQKAVDSCGFSVSPSQMSPISAVFLRSHVTTTVLSLILLLIPAATSLTCHQCNGWTGRGYSPRKYTVPTCDNMNNMCYTTIFCVKIVDPIEHKRHYATYKSDCYYQTTMLVNATITETISNRKCYMYSDGGQPPKTYLYCFCNDRDYCNSAITTSSSLFILSTAVLAALYHKLIA